MCGFVTTYRTKMANFRGQTKLHTMINTFPVGTTSPRTMISCVNFITDAALAERISVAAEIQGITLFHASLATLNENLASQRPEPVLVRFSSFGPEAISLLQSVRVLSPNAAVIVIL